MQQFELTNESTSSYACDLPPYVANPQLCSTLRLLGGVQPTAPVTILFALDLGPVGPQKFAFNGEKWLAES